MNKSEQWEAMRAAVAVSDGCWLAEYRKQGRDMFFQWYLLGQRMRIVGAHLARAIATPILNLFDRWARRG